MPRFFFNHRSSDGQQQVDVDGLKLDTLNAAVDEAAFAAEAAVALSEEAVSGEFQIEDEGRVVVARVPYTAADHHDNDAVPEQQ